MIRHTNWHDMQEGLGCFTCRFAESAAIGKRPCCTHSMGPGARPGLLVPGAPQCSRHKPGRVATDEVG